MDIQLSAIIFQILNFGIVFFVMYKFLLQPIVSILEQRRKRIADGLKAAEKNLKAQEELEEKEKQTLAEARSKAQKLAQQSKKDAQVEADSMLAEAKTQADKVLEKERKTLEASYAAEKKKLEAKVSDLVSKTTAALLKEYLTADQQKKILDKQIDALKGVAL